MEARPKISIITINFNNEVGLALTMDSVLTQSYPLIEYIVIDGGSTDRSKAVIENHASALACWASEADTGIYNAMNKGIKKATGDYILFLNSGDSLIDNQIIENVVAIGLTHDLVYGDLQFFNSEKQWVWQLPATLTFNTFYTNTIAHPSTFIRRSLFDTVGLYDEGLSIVSDWKFFLLATAKFNCSYKHIDQIISAYNFDGLSSKPENLPAINAERKNVLEQEFPFFIPDYADLTALKAEIKKMKNWIKVRNLFKRNR